MLHVRVVSPVALTEQLTSLLATAPGVQNMVTRAEPCAGPRATRWSSISATARPTRSLPLLNVSLLIVVGAAGLSAQRAIWRRRRT